MGVVTMAFAHYPTFFSELWSGLRPLCESSAFVSGMRELRKTTEDDVAGLGVPPISQRLLNLGYADREKEGIRACLEVFSHGNPAYLLPSLGFFSREARSEHR